jgi:4-aminobutyrate aminotransferase / (S)-3-amino-2-methylpropionate transaminase / 5-aminovalerate transaminase
MARPAACSDIGDESKQGYGPLPGGQYTGAVRRLLSMPVQAELSRLRYLLRRFRAQQIKHSSAGAIAAILVEPMQGTAGNVIPPDDWLPAVKSSRRKTARC